jgi:Rieske Fe-S protein
MGMQTDSKIAKKYAPVKVSVKQQTERKPLDIFREDWMDSIVFRKAVKNEAILRNLPFEEVKGIEDEDISDDETSIDDNDEFINPADARETAGESGLETDAVFGNS